VTPVKLYLLRHPNLGFISYIRVGSVEVRIPPDVVESWLSQDLVEPENDGLDDDEVKARLQAEAAANYPELTPDDLFYDVQVITLPPAIVEAIVGKSGKGD